MKFKSLFLLVIMIFLNLNIFSQNDSLKLNKKRVFIVGSSVVAGVGLSYFYVKNSWWSDQQIPFHFDSGADLKYALNVDKIGHFMGGLESADIFTSSMKWAGMQDRQALWYGVGFGTILQIAIETKDAYSPYWGFSKWDLALGTLGSLWPVAQYYSNELEAINFKFSYYKHSNTYWDLERQRDKQANNYAWQDDYPNQTYWATFDISHFIETCCWPKWLNLAFGFGLDDTQYLDNNNTKIGGNNEWYIALDYDIPKMLKKWDSPIGRRVKHWLNYIHLPSPTIRISPKLEFYPLFI